MTKEIMSKIPERPKKNLANISEYDVDKMTKGLFKLYHMKN